MINSKLADMNHDDLVKIKNFQRSEITEYYVYKNLSRLSKNPENKKILKTIADDEYRHYNFWKKISKQDVPADRLKVFFYSSLARILGLMFTTKLMELGEENAQVAYRDFSAKIPRIEKIITDEDRHELDTLNLINDRFLKYVGSIVLGLNDALVELTGALAGLTFALADSALIALVGFITGVAASLSMAASEYLSIKSEEKNDKDALRASLYTGTAYLIVVLLLISPYLILSRVYFSLVMTLMIAVLIIVFFSFYVSVAQQISFKKHFTQMLVISMGVAAVSFAIGIILRKSLGIET